MQMRNEKFYLFIFWLLRVEKFIYRVTRVLFSWVCTTVAFLALFTSMKSLPSKARIHFLKMSDETSVRGLIPILSFLMHSTGLYYSQEESLPFVDVPCFLWCLWIQKHDLLSVSLPRKNTGSLLRPLSIVMCQAYNSLTALDRDAGELIA